MAKKSVSSKKSTSKKSLAISKIVSAIGPKKAKTARKAMMSAKSKITNSIKVSSKTGFVGRSCPGLKGSGCGKLLPYGQSLCDTCS